MRCSAASASTARKLAKNGGSVQPSSRGHVAAGLLAVCLALACVPLVSSGCSRKSSSTHLSASPRLHLVAILYGKYMSAHHGEMPADEHEFVEYVDTNEREVLQRYGLRSGQDVFTEVVGRPRLVVMYRDQRQRMPTEFVAMEEQKAGGAAGKGAGDEMTASKSRWVAADALGVGQEISVEEANRVLADAEVVSKKLNAPAESKGGTSGSEKQGGKS